MVDRTSKTSFVWLLEMKDFSKHPIYFSPGWNGLEWHWITTDANEAVTFASEESARRLMNLFPRLDAAILTEEKWHAVQHGFLGGAAHETGGSHSERYRVALQKIIDDGDYTAPEGMKLIAREALANGTCESRAALDVLAERLRQVSIEGWTQGHDDSHTRGTLAKAAAAYVWSAIYELSDGFIGPRADVYHASRHWGWPWNADWWKPKGPRSDLVRAGALIIAEIERLDRSSSEKASEPPPTPWPGSNPNKSTPGRCPAREVEGDRCIEAEFHEGPHRWS